MTSVVHLGFKDLQKWILGIKHSLVAKKWVSDSNIFKRHQKSQEWAASSAIWKLGHIQCETSSRLISKRQNRLRFRCFARALSTTSHQTVSTLLYLVRLELFFFIAPPKLTNLYLSRWHSDYIQQVFSNFFRAKNSVFVCTFSEW